MTFKHFKYLKERNKKVHKMNNNMVKVWSNFSYVMCHNAFIKEQSQMPSPIMFKSSSDDLALLNNQDKMKINCN
jgi:hypothetical protein